MIRKARHPNAQTRGIYFRLRRTQRRLDGKARTRGGEEARRGEARSVKGEYVGGSRREPPWTAPLSGDRFVAWRFVEADDFILASTRRAPGGMAGLCSPRPAAVGTGAAHGLRTVSQSSHARSVVASAGGSRRHDARATPPVRHVIGRSRCLSRFQAMMPHASSERTTDAAPRGDLARRVVRDAAGLLRGFRGDPRARYPAHGRTGRRLCLRDRDVGVDALGPRGRAARRDRAE